MTPETVAIRIFIRSHEIISPSSLLPTLCFPGFQNGIGHVIGGEAVFESRAGHCAAALGLGLVETIQNFLTVRGRNENIVVFFRGDMFDDPLAQLVFLFLRQFFYSRFDFSYSAHSVKKINKEKGLRQEAFNQNEGGD